MWTSKLLIVKRFLTFLLLLALAGARPNLGQPVSTGAQSPLPGQALVDKALANELAAAQDASHPMCYQLYKTSPRLSTTKEILETKDGGVARLLSVNNQPLSDDDEQKEQARLAELVADPGKQRRRKQSEDADSGRALNVLRVLPAAFLYQYAGSADSPSGMIEKFTFRPNPHFYPPDFETQVLTQMAGEIWIDPAHERVVRLEGHLQHDVDFGWGILGRLSNGGWITIDQADVGGGVWRIVRFEMKMSGRVVFKNRVFDTTEEESHFAPLPMGLSYQKAIEMVRNGPEATAAKSSAK